MAVKREQVMQNAERFVSRGRIDAAIREYRKVLADNPDDANTLNRIGDLYARVDKVDDAIRLYRRIAQRYTDDGFFVKAIAIYKKILKLDPTQLEVYERLAGLYHRQGLINEARGQYQVLVDYYLKHENLASAINIQSRMAELEPDNPTHHLRLAELYRQEGLTAKAIREYGEIAHLMIEHDHAEEATKVLLRAVEVDPTDLDFLRDAVHELQSAGATGLAAHLLAIAVSKNPAARELAPELGRGAGARATESPSEERALEAEAEEAPATAVEEVEQGAEVEAGTAVPPPRQAEAVEEPEVVPDSGFAPAPSAAPSEPEPELSLDDTTTVFELDVDSLEDEIADFKQGEAPPAASEEAERPSSEPAAEPVAEEQAGHDIDWTFVGDDLDLAELPPAETSDELAEQTEGAAQEVVIEEPAKTGGPIIEIDQEALARAAAEIEPQREIRASDLIAEAQVLAKYGLEDKALDRLRQALEREPRNVEALAETTVLYVKRGQLARAAGTATELARNVSGETEKRLWETTRERLVEAGFRISDDQVRPPAKRRGGDQEVDRLLAGLMAEAGQSSAGRRKARSAKEPATPMPMDFEASLRDAVEKEEPVAAPATQEAAPADWAGTPSAGRKQGEEEEIDWLDELAPKGEAPTADKESLFASEEQFFDLAAEIEQELAEEEIGEIIPPGPAEEPSLDEIVEGFKKGVAQNLSPEDFDTHFNLGIAYREMGLLDEAIGEFQLAAKDPRYLVDCCSMLGASFVDKGLPELAMKWYQRALDSPIVTEEATLGLLYEKGNVEMGAGMLAEAYKTFVELYGINSNFRDVVAKIQELKDKV